MLNAVKKIETIKYCNVDTVRDTVFPVDLSRIQI